MVDAPAAALATTVWQAVLAKPSVITELTEMTFQSHPILRFLLNGEVQRRQGVEGGGKAKGSYGVKKVYFEATRAIEKSLIKGSHVTTGVIAVADAVTTDIDAALPAKQLRLLSGGFGVVYAHMSSGLEEHINGSGSGDGLFRWFEDIVVPDVGQQLSDKMNAGLYSDGTTDKFDGFEYWVRASGGAKWNSNVMATDTFLQGQAWSVNESDWSKSKLREAIRRAWLGSSSAATYSDGRKPNIGIMTTALFYQFKDWMDDKESVNRPAAAETFLELGTPEDFFIFDGVLFFPDPYLDSLIDTEYGFFYLLHTDDIRLIFHKDFTFGSIDPFKVGGDAPEALTWIDLPNYLFKQIVKKIILANFLYMRPRNFLKGTVNAA